MSAIEWRDATSYSRGANHAPDSWECNIGGFRVWISSRHLYYPGRWVMNCDDLDIRHEDLGPSDSMDDEAAQEFALVYFIGVARKTASKLLMAAEDAEDAGK